MRTTLVFLHSFFILCLLAIPHPAEASFRDVRITHPYREAIDYLQSQGIVQGYPDHSFQPEATINRAEFTKIMVRALYEVDVIDHCIERRGIDFTDVRTTDWFAPEVCMAKFHGIVKGYEDGNFRPGQTINFAEASTIMLRALGITLRTDALWYKPAIEELGSRSAIPTTVTGVDHLIMRGEMAEVLWRLQKSVLTSPSLTSDDLLYEGCQRYEEDIIPGIDMAKIRRTWLSWNNVERAKRGRQPFTADPQLHRTAFLWSRASAEKGLMSHRRDGAEEEYDFDAISAWFENLGVTFANVNRSTFTENIGRVAYSCEEEDCTQVLIDALRTIFDLYLAEEGQKEQPHFSAIMSDVFTEIGFGIAQNVEQEKLYITVHYGTRITSRLQPLCPWE